MLILTRKIGESFVIGEDTYITVMGYSGNQIRLGIDAASSISIHREEIHEKIQQQKKEIKRTKKIGNNNNRDCQIIN